MKIKGQISRIVYVCSILFLVLASISSFCTVFFALDFTDSFYHGCNFLLSGKICAFLPLTQGLYLSTHAICGDYVLAYRIINWLVYFAACLMVYVCLVHKKGQYNSMGIVLLSIAIFAIPLTNTNVFNGNGLSSLFLSVTFIALNRCSSGNKIWYFGLFLSIICAILSRFPNIVVVAMVMLTSLMIFPKKDAFNIFLATIGSVLAYIVIECLLYGGLTNYANELSIAFAQNMSGGDADHGIRFLFGEYLHTLKDMMSDIKYLSIIAIIPFIGCFFKKRVLGIISAFVFILGQVAFMYLRVKLISDVINYFLLVFFYSNICILTFVLCIISLIKKDIKSFGLNLLPLLVSLCAAAGSDTGLFLIGGPLFVMLPWLIIQFKSQFTCCNKDDILKIIVALFLLALSAAIYVRQGMMLIGVILFALVLVVAWTTGDKKLYLPFGITFQLGDYNMCLTTSTVLMCLLSLGLTVNAKINVSFHDRPMKALTCQYDVPQLKGIWTNTISRRFMDSVLDDYEDISENQAAIFFGRNSAIFSYVIKTGMVNGVNFSQEDSEQNICCLKSAIKNRPVVFLCPENPGIPSRTKLEDYPRTNEMLLNKGYVCVDKGEYAIYYPSGTTPL